MKIFIAFALSSLTNAKVTYFLWMYLELLLNNVARSLKPMLKTNLPLVGITFFILQERLMPQHQVSSKGIDVPSRCECVEVQAMRSST